MLRRRIAWLAALLALVGGTAIVFAGRGGKAVLPVVRGWVSPPVPQEPLRAGDIVFQTSDSAESRAIQLATHSPLTHVGIVVHAGGPLAVFEAEGKVKTTPLDQWILRSPGSFVAKRLKASAHPMTPEEMGKLAAAAKKHLGKPYDAAFEWTDAKMYCSELVWKVYHAALGVDLGEPRPLRAFDLSSPEVKKALAQRYGKKIPLDSVMIAPEQIFESDLLETVRDDRK